MRLSWPLEVIRFAVTKAKRAIRECDEIHLSEWAKFLRKCDEAHKIQLAVQQQFIASFNQANASVAVSDA